MAGVAGSAQPSMCQYKYIRDKWLYNIISENNS
jgi:hypothetical protein